MGNGEQNWPKGPYRFDDISSRNQDDGLGYVYLADGGCSPTLAHTGDMGLTAAENRGLGNLFATAPELYEALEQAEEWLEGWASAEPQLSIIRAALAKAQGK